MDPTSRSAAAKQTDLASIRAALRSNVKQLHRGDSSSIDVILTLRLTNIVLQDLIDGYSRSFGLSAARSNALLALYSAEGHTMPAHRLADTLYSSRANVTWLIGSLVDSGLVDTRTSIDDRRSKTVSLTKSGLALVKQFAPVHYEASEKALAALDRAERKVLLNLLDKIRQHSIVAGEQIIAGATKKRKNSS